MRSTQAILGQDFTVKSHLRFAFPRMMMSLFIMSYVVADGALISYYLGTVALASLNMVFPLAGFLSAIGMMLSAGGGSVVSRRLGDQRAHDADRALSTIVYANIVIGIVLAAIGTYLIPAGEFNRVTDEQTGRTLVIPGTFHRVEQTPVSFFDTFFAFLKDAVNAGFMPKPCYERAIVDSTASDLINKLLAARLAPELPRNADCFDHK